MGETSVPGITGDPCFAGRVYQNIWSQSKVGLLYTNGDPMGPGRNSLLGMDFRYGTSRLRGDKNFSVDAWGAYNWNPLRGGHHEAYGFKVDFPNDRWDIALLHLYYGDALKPGLGYLRRNGGRSLYAHVSYRPRPEGGWIGRMVRQFFFETSASMFWDLRNALETAEFSCMPLSFHTERGVRFEATATATRDRLPYDFEVADGVVIPSGAYTFVRYGLECESPSYMPVAAGVEVHSGRFYTGVLTGTGFKIAWRGGGRVALEAGAELNRGRLPQGDFDENVFRVKADFFVSPDLGLMNYIQYDDASRNLGVSMRLRWEVSPGNQIFWVYGKSWDRKGDPRDRFIALDERGVIKIQLSLRP
jgi:hypothetical protein